MTVLFRNNAGRFWTPRDIRGVEGVKSDSELAHIFCAENGISNSIRKGYDSQYLQTTTGTPIILPIPLDSTITMKSSAASQYGPWNASWGFNLTMKFRVSSGTDEVKCVLKNSSGDYWEVKLDFGGAGGAALYVADYTGGSLNDDDSTTFFNDVADDNTVVYMGIGNVDDGSALGAFAWVYIKHSSLGERVYVYHADRDLGFTPDNFEISSVGDDAALLEVSHGGFGIIGDSISNYGVSVSFATMIGFRQHDGGEDFFVEDDVLRYMSGKHEVSGYVGGTYDAIQFSSEVLLTVEASGNKGPFDLLTHNHRLLPTGATHSARERTILRPYKNFSFAVSSENVYSDIKVSTVESILDTTDPIKDFSVQLVCKKAGDIEDSESKRYEDCPEFSMNDLQCGWAFDRPKNYLNRVDENARYADCQIAKSLEVLGEGYELFYYVGDHRGWAPSYSNFGLYCDVKHVRTGVVTKQILIGPCTNTVLTVDNTLDPLLSFKIVHIDDQDIVDTNTGKKYTSFLMAFVSDPAFFTSETAIPFYVSFDNGYTWHSSLNGGGVFRVSLANIANLDPTAAHEIRRFDVDYTNGRLVVAVEMYNGAVGPNNDIVVVAFDRPLFRADGTIDNYKLESNNYWILDPVPDFFPGADNETSRKYGTPRVYADKTRKNFWLVVHDKTKGRSFIYTSSGNDGFAPVIAFSATYEYIYSFEPNSKYALTRSGDGSAFSDPSVDGHVVDTSIVTTMDGYAHVMLNTDTGVMVYARMSPKYIKTAAGWTSDRITTSFVDTFETNVSNVTVTDNHVAYYDAVDATSNQRRLTPYYKFSYNEPASSLGGIFVETWNNQNVLALYNESASRGAVYVSPHLARRKDEILFTCTQYLTWDYSASTNYTGVDSMKRTGVLLSNGFYETQYGSRHTYIYGASGMMLDSLCKSTDVPHDMWDYAVSGDGTVSEGAPLAEVQCTVQNGTAYVYHRMPAYIAFPTKTYYELNKSLGDMPLKYGFEYAFDDDGTGAAFQIELLANSNAEHASLRLEFSSAGITLYDLDISSVIQAYPVPVSATDVQQGVEIIIRRLSDSRFHLSVYFCDDVSAGSQSDYSLVISRTWFLRNTYVGSYNTAIGFTVDPAASSSVRLSVREFKVGREEMSKDYSTDRYVFKPIASSEQFIYDLNDETYITLSKGHVDENDALDIIRYQPKSIDDALDLSMLRGVELDVSPPTTIEFTLDHLTVGNVSSLIDGVSPTDGYVGNFDALVLDGTNVKEFTLTLHDSSGALVGTLGRFTTLKFVTYEYRTRQYPITNAETIDGVSHPNKRDRVVTFGYGQNDIEVGDTVVICDPYGSNTDEHEVVEVFVEEQEDSTKTYPPTKSIILDGDLIERRGVLAVYANSIVVDISLIDEIIANYPTAVTLQIEIHRDLQMLADVVNRRTGSLFSGSNMNYFGFMSAPVITPGCGFWKIDNIDFVERFETHSLQESMSSEYKLNKVYSTSVEGDHYTALSDRLLVSHTLKHTVSRRDLSTINRFRDIVASRTYVWLGQYNDPLRVMKTIVSQRIAIAYIGVAADGMEYNTVEIVLEEV